MASLQDEIRQALHTQPELDLAREIERRRDFLIDYVSQAGASGLVLAISGGQDSSLAGRLCQLAVERARADGRHMTFTAVRMPYGVQADEDDAQAAISFIRPDDALTTNILGGVDAICDEYFEATGQRMTDHSKGNVKARVRMVLQYAIAGDRGAIVVGTDHAAEAVTGFFTKFGDGGADVVPLSGLTKGQGRDMLRHLGAPSRLYEKAPTADLLDHVPGQTDEDSLGVTYDAIDGYLTGGQTPPDDAELIERKYRATEHKRRLPVTFQDDWWRTSQVG
ncbi:ammonia-dependent NAD(+) synthetase [Lysobacter korlensis]|uniref:NH(3)-dependent NAD(+) synthetase n=1 Tax=Lysobacter korlensis TaxID=553636 RepID=A0ABV6RYB3_9GAMM